MSTLGCELETAGSPIAIGKVPNKKAPEKSDAFQY